MSIKIYWGANGAYKSSSAVQDDIIPELLKGRVVVTNIRGCTLDKCLEQYPEIPDEADIIYIDTAVAGSMDRLQTWFRWVPKGALIVIDEVQLVHRSAWRERDLEKFILQVEVDGQTRNATFEEAEQLGQPFDMLDAFTRHRHFNWDLVLTTPNIKYVRSDIRNTCETAYRQANGALLGFKGRFKRSMHDADDNKPSNTALTQTLSIKQKTFACYSSTSTGKTQDTRAGTNIFKSPRLLLALACCFGGFAYAFGTGGLDYVVNGPVRTADGNLVQKDNKANLDNIEKNIHMDNTKDITSYSRPADADLSIQSRLNADAPLISTDIFAGYDASLTYFEGYKSGSLIYFLVEFDHWEEQGQAFSVSSNELKEIGYKYKFLTECSILLYYGNTSRLLTCWKPQPAKSEVEVNSDDFNPIS